MKRKTLINKFKHILNEYVTKYDIRDPKKRGRFNKFNNFFYIKHILNYLFTGNSWNDIELFVNNITGDAIRKKFNKWIYIGIF